MSNIVIIGSGPAGVSAALYAARAGVDTTVLTKGPGRTGPRRAHPELLRLCRTHLRCQSWNAGASEGARALWA